MPNASSSRKRGRRKCKINKSALHSELKGKYTGSFLLSHSKDRQRWTEIFIDQIVQQLTNRQRSTKNDNDCKRLTEKEIDKTQQKLKRIDRI